MTGAMMEERESDLGRSQSTQDKFISSSVDNGGLTIRWQASYLDLALYLVCEYTGAVT